LQLPLRFSVLFRSMKNNVGPLYSVFIASEFLKDRSFYYLLRSLDSLFKGLYRSKTLGLPCNFRNVEGIIQRALHALQLYYSYFHTELNFKYLLFFPFTDFSKGVNVHTFNVYQNSEVSDVTLLKWQPTVAET
jgi:hypothetical protein